MLPLILPVIIGEKPAYQWRRRALVGLGGMLVLCMVMPGLQPFVVVPALGLAAGFLVFVLMPTNSIFLLGWPLQLTPEGVQLEERFVASDDLRRVQVTFAGYKGQPMGGRVPPHNGGGNQLVVHLRSGEQLPAVQFFAPSKGHQQQLVTILKRWRQMGVEVAVAGLDLA